MFQANPAMSLIGGLLLFNAIESSASDYTFQTLDNPADPTFNQLLGINNAGTIAGYYGSGATGHPNQGYTLAPPNNYTSQNFPGSAQTQVTGINNNGLTVGFWVDGTGANSGFVNDHGTFTSVIDPLAPSGGVTQLLAVNDHNVAAGFYLDGKGNAQGFTYGINGGFFSQLAINGATSSTIAGINNTGDFAGFYAKGADTFGFIVNGGNLLSLQYPGSASTQILGLNNSGKADGFFTDTAGNMNGFVYDIPSHTFMVVDAPNGRGGTVLNGLNDQGQLTGFYIDAAGNTHGLLATPVIVPVPAPFVLTLSGLGMIALNALRRGRKPA